MNSLGTYTYGTCNLPRPGAAAAAAWRVCTFIHQNCRRPTIPRTACQQGALVVSEYETRSLKATWYGRCRKKGVGLCWCETTHSATWCTRTLDIYILYGLSQCSWPVNLSASIFWGERKKKVLLIRDEINELSTTNCSSTPTSWRMNGRILNPPKSRLRLPTAVLNHYQRCGQGKTDRHVKSPSWPLVFDNRYYLPTSFHATTVGLHWTSPTSNQNWYGL